MKNDHDHAEKKVAKAAEAAVKNAEPMTQNQYKIPLFSSLIEQQLMAIAQPGPG
jgi:CO/xanthine dehydrogenase FAD-binding subunit